MVLASLFTRKRRLNDFPYYRRVWLQVVLTLLAASFIPLLVIGGGVSSFTFGKMEESALDNLRMQVRSHQKAIDQFLAERMSQLKMMAAMQSRNELCRPGRLQYILTSLQRQMPGFVDLGVIDPGGIQRAYVGPYDLTGRRYEDQGWFKRMKGRDSYISDVFLGHRQSPHFIMAVKAGSKGEPFILRATIDSEYFNTLVAGGAGELKADTFVVNAQGVFQTKPREGGELLAASGIKPDPRLKGIQLAGQGNVLRLMLWQKNISWLNVVQVSKDEVFAPVRRARSAVLIIFIAGAFFIIAAILLTTGNLVGRLEVKGQHLRILDKQLRRTSYLASSMELAMGFFDEIRDILSNIQVSVQWLVSHNSADGEPELKEPLYQIAGEATRGHALFEKFVAFVRPTESVVTEVNTGELLDELLVFLKRELECHNIRVIRDYQDPLPTLRSDRGKLRQVMQNLLLNAVGALGQGGEIRLTIRRDKDQIVVEVRDNGPGIPPEQQGMVFEPLFTTKAQGTGLGLPICRSILNQLGGGISLESEPGKGAAFTVKLPLRINGQG